MSAAQQELRVEKAARTHNGYIAVALGLGSFALGVAALISSLSPASGGTAPLLAGLALLLAGSITLLGLYMQQPNEARILTLFGRYCGSDRSEGLRWANPLMIKRRLSLRSRNLNAPILKVNDKRGNPVEISAAVVWRVQDTARAVFEVDDYEAYVRIQAEAAIRHLAAQFAYDEGDEVHAKETTLRAGQDEVAAALIKQLQERLGDAGVQVQDAKITHLAYAAEIAQVMLRRQQAEAIISARKKIVLGAVSMVEEALKGLSERAIVELDDERKAAMVSNLLVVLCSDKETQPIVNTGTLYN
ncbi:regulator of protease activity HflC (stomatin/prohibitin superfamily) [Paucibacter oligotrophus]|uniref:Regulator of protease activity HflC (Stomatin/prohibitin superfamily) n=1 Tax=Roseateles oligotrophus TaxID=1769250 RepID=A0A840L3J8_9BURK|nr:SPFH domain-containing protein [Roseateles oligotrophus]MBB4843084.1 regulator of protease activity HflC (stomatin/prohibitin superfamily) [Roseateles oligotrophus]